MNKTIELKGIDLQQLFGVADSNLKLIEDSFPASLIVRGNKIQIDGNQDQIRAIRELIHEMIQTLSRKGSLTTKDVKQLVDVIKIDNGSFKNVPDNVVHYGSKGAIIARTVGQTEYIELVRNNDIVFSIGPAGTGKTFLAVAFAVAALDNHEIDRIVLCRPAVEAGESLGFLPGDLKEKVDPYLTPLYDAMAEMMSPAKLKPLLTKNIIEVIPLAYMRGRTLNNAFMMLIREQLLQGILHKLIYQRIQSQV
jgi:phosphate starvation-inducible PhoH-like protein